MRRFTYVLATAIPLIGASPALAEDVLIQVGAQRGSDLARSTAEEWDRRFDDVVTFALSDGWVGIGLGPMPRDQATARLETLKAQGQVPADSFIAPAAGEQLTPVGEATEGPQAGQATAGATAAGSPSTFPAPDAMAATETPAAVTSPEPVAPPSPPQVFLRLDSSSDRAKAEEMLAKWHESLPEAGLWTLANGRSAVAYGPMDEATGKAWLAVFRRAELVSKDVILTPAAEMGEPAIPGRRPELGAPPAPGDTPLDMPPLENVQRALRWAGHYDGAIDGKDGPMTRAAILAEIVRLRASPDATVAMRELIRRREAWQAEMHLTDLRDDHTGLSLPAPMDKLQFDRTERALSIYGPRNGSGAALILFSQPGGQQEMLDLVGLATALGWVPAPSRQIQRGSAILDGQNDTHIGHAEGRVVDGRVQGFVLIWPAGAPEEQRRMAAEISDNLSRWKPGAGEPLPAEPAAVAPNPAASSDPATPEAAVPDAGPAAPAGTAP